MKFHLRNISVCALEAFADQFSRESPLVPITKSRAASQSRNPHARGTDIALIAAYFGNRCIGYHGQIPAYLNIEGKLHPIYWGSTLYVDPAFRGKGVAGILLEAVKHLDKDFVVTRITPKASAVLQKAGIRLLGELAYCQLRVDRLKPFQAAWSTLKNSRIRNRATRDLNAKNFLLFPVTLLYEMRKRAFYGRAVRLMGGCDRSIENRLVRRISGDADTVVSRSGRFFFHRDLRSVNWMLQYPWITSRSGNERKLKNYHFSHRVERFQYVPVEFYRPGKLQAEGFVIFSVLRHHGKTRLKILEYFFRSEQEAALIPRMAIKLAGKFLADRIEFSQNLKPCFDTYPVFLSMSKTQHRSYLYHPRSPESPFAGCAGKISFDFPDGDTAFT